MTKVRDSPSLTQLQSEQDELLRDILKKLHDSSELFSSLAKHCRLPAIQRYAAGHLGQWNDFARELRTEMHDPSRAPADGSIVGTLRKLGKGFLAMFPAAEARVLRTIDNAETSLRAAYLSALERNPASPELREKLHRQQACVSRAQAQLRSLQHHP